MRNKAYNGLLQQPSTNRANLKHEFTERDEYSKKIITDHAVSLGLNVVRCLYSPQMSSQNSSAYLLVVEAKYEDIKNIDPCVKNFKLIMNTRIWNPLSQENIYRAILMAKDIDIDNQMI